MARTYPVPPSQVSQYPDSNLINPETRGPILEIVTIILLVITLVVCSLRLWMRFVIARKSELDDWLVIWALFFGVGHSVVINLMVYNYHADRHLWDTKVSTWKPGRMLGWFQQLFFLWSTCLVKISILTVYRRLGSGGAYGRKTVFLLRAAIVLVILYWLIFTVNLFVVCRPLTAYWDFTVQHAKCFDEKKSITAAIALGVATDFMAAIFPVGLFWRLTISKKKKILICGLFGLGYLTCVTGVVRAVYVIKIFHELDFTWWGYPCWLWSAIECDLGIICASAPTLKAFYSHYFPHSKLEDDHPTFATFGRGGDGDVDNSI